MVSNNSLFFATQMMSADIEILSLFILCGWVPWSAFEGKINISSSSVLISIEGVLNIVFSLIIPLLLTVEFVNNPGTISFWKCSAKKTKLESSSFFF